VAQKEEGLISKDEIRDTILEVLADLADTLKGAGAK